MKNPSCSGNCIITSSLLQFDNSVNSFIIRNYSEDDFKTFGEFYKFALVQDGSEEGFFKVLQTKQNRPHYFPQKDLFIAEYNKKIIGFADITPELGIGRIIVEGFVHPEYRQRGVATQLMGRVLPRGAKLGARCSHFCIPESSSITRKFLLKMGFSSVRCYLELKTDLSEASEHGYNLSSSPISHLNKGDEAVLADIQNKIFSGSWGFCPNVPDDIRYYLDLTQSELEDILLIKKGTETAGYLWPLMLSARDLPSGRKQGCIHMFGVKAEFRGMGLGKELLSIGHIYLKRKGAGIVKLTVDQDNTQAFSLYRSFGYGVTARKFWYEKDLSL